MQGTHRHPLFVHHSFNSCAVYRLPACSDDETPTMQLLARRRDPGLATG